MRKVIRYALAIMLLIALSLTALPVFNVQATWPASIDYTSFTESDPSSKITIASSTLSVSDIHRNQGGAVYKAWTGTTFHYRETLLVTSMAGDGSYQSCPVVIGLGNFGGDLGSYGYSGRYLYGLGIIWDTGTIVLGRVDYNNGSLSYDSKVTGLVVSANSTHYIDFYRNSANSTVISIYSDSSYTTLEKQLTGTCSYTFSYILGFANQNATGDHYTLSCSMQNLQDFGSPPVDPPIVATYSAQMGNNGVYLPFQVQAGSNNVNACGIDVWKVAGTFQGTFYPSSQNVTAGASAYKLSFSSNLTSGFTYTAQAWASTDNGTNKYWGGIVYFTYAPVLLQVTTYPATWNPPDMPSTATNLSLSGDIGLLPDIADNVTLNLGIAPGDTSLNSSIHIVNHRTIPGVYPAGVYGWYSDFTLSGNITYYYQAKASVNGTAIYGQTLPTQYSVATSIPIVTITKIENITSNGFDVYANVYSQAALTVVGFQVSHSADFATNRLIGTTYPFIAQLKPDNTFGVSISNLAQDSNIYWYVQAEAQDVNGHIGHSQLSNQTLVTVITTPTTTPTTPVGTAPPDATQLLDNLLAMLHLHGTLAKWLLLVFALLIEGLLFGFAIIKTDNQKLKSILAMVLGICAIATTGGFIFSGYLGVWPIVVLCAAAVTGGIIVAGNSLGGQGG